MTGKSFCSDCNQNKDCRKVYQQLGGYKGPSVVNQVLIAFLLPITVFIITLFAVQKAIPSTVSTPNICTVISFLIAAATTFLVVLLTSLIQKRKKSGAP